MKIWLIAAAVLVTVGFSTAFAQSEDADDAEKERAERQRMIAEKKEEINGSRWEVELKPQYGTESNIPLKDTLTFQDGMFKSKYLSSMAFTPTKYTVRVKPNGLATWETMQTSRNPDEGIAFWKGQWDGQTMSGSTVRRIPEEANQDFYFSSKGFKEIPATSEEEESGGEGSSDTSWGAPQALVSEETEGYESEEQKGFWSS